MCMRLALFVAVPAGRLLAVDCCDLFLKPAGCERGRRARGGHAMQCKTPKLPRRQLAYRSCCFTRMYAIDFKNPEANQKSLLMDLLAYENLHA